MTTSAHPSREQWAARQASLPEAARVLLASIERKRTDERNAAEIEAFKRRAESEAWRAKFEAALATTLVAAGAEWLVPFRVPDHQCAKLPTFTGVSQYFFAMFDASAFGLWPIMLQMQEITSGRSRDWRPNTNGRWRIGRPTGEVSYSEFPLALEWAAEYVASPF